MSWKPFDFLFGTGVSSLEEPSVDTFYDTPKNDYPQLPEGMTPISPSKVTAEPNKDLFNTDDVKRMAGEVINPKKGATEFTAQRGKDKIIVKGTAPSEVIEAPEGRGGVVMPSNLPIGEYSPGAYIQPENMNPSFWQQLGEVVTSPQFRYTLAQAGQAIAPNSPGIQQMGDFAKQLVTSDIAKNYRAALEKGEDPDVVRGSELLTLEQKSGLRKEAAEKQRAGVTEENLRAMTEQYKATAGGIAPYGEKFEQEQLLTMLKIANDPEDWQPWGYGQMRSKKTGDIVKVPTAPRENPDAEGIQERQWYKLAESLAIRSPSVQQYIGKGGIVVDAYGNTNIQWTDPIKGEAALKAETQRRLGGMTKAGFMRESTVQALTGGEEISVATPQELTTIPTAAEIAAMAVGTEFTVQGKTWRKRPDGNVERVK